MAEIPCSGTAVVSFALGTTDSTLFMVPTNTPSALLSLVSVALSRRTRNHRATSLPPFLLAKLRITGSPASCGPPSTGRANQRKAPGRFVRLSHGQTHYEIHSAQQSSMAELSATAPLVVVCHGLCGAAETWRTDGLRAVFDWSRGAADTGRRGMSAELCKRGYQVLNFDLYGHGWSDAPGATYSVDLFVGQLTELLDALEIRRPFVLYGFSMGCFISVNYVTRHPSRVCGLILHSPWTHRFPAALVLLAYVVPGLAELLGLLVTLATDNILRVRTFTSILRNHNSRGGWSELLREFVPSVCTAQRLSTIGEFPMLLIAGDARPAESMMLAQAHTIAEACGQHGQVKVGLGAGHGCWFQGADQHRAFFQAEVSRWAAQHRDRLFPSAGDATVADSLTLLRNTAT